MTGYGGHVGTLVCQRRTKLVHRWCCTVPICIHVLPFKSFLHLYIYIYIGANKQFISLQTYRHTPMHILTLYNAFNYQIYIKYKFIYSVPYLRRNPCQEEILTRQHHGFPLNDNPMILLRYLYGLCQVSHWDIPGCRS